MTLSEVLKLGMAYIAEQTDGADNGDLTERAALLLPAVITGLMPLDRAYSGQPDKLYTPYTGELTDAFQLCEPLVPLCALKLGYLLAADENTVLYTVLKSEFDAAKEDFINSLPSSRASITDIYQ